MENAAIAKTKNQAGNHPNGPADRCQLLIRIILPRRQPATCLSTGFSAPDIGILVAGGGMSRTFPKFSQSSSSTA
jgi:hypothetical protein